MTKTERKIMWERRRGPSISEHVAQHHYERISELENLMNLGFYRFTRSTTKLVLFLDPTAAFRSDGVVEFILVGFLI